MATDLRTGILEKEEYLNNARIMYSPVILALQNKEFHNVDVSRVKFKEYNVEKDSIVAEVLTKEATEKAHIKARGVEKTFNIFVKGAKFIKSLADGAVADLQKVHNSVLRDYMIIFEKDVSDPKTSATAMAEASISLLLSDDKRSFKASKDFFSINSSKSISFVVFCKYSFLILRFCINSLQ